jgi:hypothetical protein
VLRLFAFDPDQARLRIEQYVVGNEFPAVAA